MKAPIEFLARKVRNRFSYGLDDRPAGFVESVSENTPDRLMPLESKPRAQLDKRRVLPTTGRKRRAQEGVEHVFEIRAAVGMPAHLREEFQPPPDDRLGAAAEELRKQRFLGAEMIVN